MARVIKDVDRGFKKLVRRFNMMRYGPSVTVGIQGTEAALEREFGQTNVAIAAVHEFGSRDGKIPQRSFLRSTADRERRLFQKVLERETKRAALQGNLRRGLGKVGELGVSKVQQTINQSIGLKPLSRKTIAIRVKKGRPSTRPLIDLGILKSSITWKVHGA